MARKTALLRLAAVIASTTLIVGCGGGSSPTAPAPVASPTPAPQPAAATRIIGVDGNLAFGNVSVGSSKDAMFTIRNTGTGMLTVTGLSITSGLGTVFTPSWTNGALAAGSTQTVTIHFAPTAAQAYSGTITVSADQTSGTNTIAISGTGTASSGGGGSAPPPPVSVGGRALLYGGRDHAVFLGCFSCNEFDPESVFNQFGKYGSRFSATSISNHFSAYGSEFSGDSACNQFASNPPILVDNNGRSYGALTLNQFARGAITDPAIIRWLRVVVCEVR